jgi:dTDP-4-dehydrorhamnose reductase
MSKRIIVLGVNGMAGHLITLGLKNCINQFEVIGIARNSSIIKPDVILDVTNFTELELFIKKTNADVIINCVGLLNKTAEENPDKAILINSYLPHFLEAITKYTKTKIIHISTDCVFSGKEGSYLESSLRNGVGFYAQSKALGELDNSKDLTLRTSIIGPEINRNGIGLFHWFFNQKKVIKGYTNAIWTGITTVELFKAIKSSIDEDLNGIFHLVNDEKISKFQLLEIINNEFERGLEIQLDGSYIVDKSLINTRTDFKFNVGTYKNMIHEMKLWIESHSEIYPHYYSES